MLFLLMVLSCKGPAGANGDDARLVDSLPPTIEWIAPDPDVSADTILILKARAHDDHAIWKVSFFIAGFEFPAMLDDSSSGLYTYEWRCLLYPEGPYPLMVRVWDESQQIGSTPERIVQVRHH
jgi:hypothetical protein